MIDFNAPLDTTSLVAEVATGTFAFKNKIKATHIRALWDNLSVFIVATLQRQKGVLLPNLGTFRVGPVVGESSHKKIRPAFNLLEGRYGGVSQERARYIVGGRCPVVQPNYGMLSIQAGVHRGATQRLLGELLQRLGVHILSGRPLKVEFPGLGSMITNKSGRFEFVFAPLFMEYFEREVYANVREMELQDDEKRQVLKGLQHVHLASPPYIMSPSGSRPPSSRPRSSRPASSSPPYPKLPSPGLANKGPYGLAGAGNAVGSASPPSPYYPTPSSAAAGAYQPMSAAAMPSPPERQATPQHDQLQALMRLCTELDRKSSGCIPRLALEGFLHKEVRPLLTHIDGATMLDLLETCTFDGKSSKLILFKPFLASLRQALKERQQPKRMQSFDEVADEDAAGSYADPFEHGADQQDQRSDISLQDMLPGQLQQEQQPPTPTFGSHPPNHTLNRPPALNLPPASPSPSPPHHNVFLPADHSNNWGLNPLVSPVPPDPNQYLHYEQTQLSPRSRAEYDNFNRAHFLQLSQVRGPEGKRAVTPKVGEEPLNYREYLAVRASSPYRSTSSTPQGAPTQVYQPFPMQPPFHANGQMPPASPSIAGPVTPPAPSTRASTPPRTQQQQQQQSHPFALPAHQGMQHHTVHPFAAPQKVNPGYSVAPQMPTPTTPAPLPTPTRTYNRPSPDLLDCLHDPVPGQPAPKPPTPRSFSPPPHISQYDIINAPPHERARLKAELKQQLQEDWRRQIQEKNEMEASVIGAGKAWPYTPVHEPNDKRPLSAISRPISPRGNHTRSPAWHI